MSVGDLLSIQGIWPTFPVPAAVEPPVPPPPRRRGGSQLPELQPAPTFHPISVNSRIAVVGEAHIGEAVPVAAEGLFAFVGEAAAAVCTLAAEMRVGVMLPAMVDGAVSLAAAEIASSVAFAGEAAAGVYNERDVRLVLGLP